MHYTMSAALCAALVLLDTASAAPGYIKRPSTAMKIERLSTGRTIQRNGARSMMRSFNKFGLVMPEMYSNATSTTSQLVSLAATGQTGITTTTPVNGDAEFLAPIQIGGQTINMDFDTGSSDLWVFNTGMPSTESAGHELFDPTKSPTFQAVKGATFNIKFGDKSGAAGTQGTDTVNIGGATVTAQAVELATAVSAQFIQDTNNNGLVGLAFSKLNTVQPAPVKTFFDNVAPSLALPVLVANLKHNTSGAYTFGAVDATQFQGSLTSMPVNSSAGFWGVQMSAFEVGNTGLQTNTQGSLAIADTGTTLLIMDDSVVFGYYSSVGGAHEDANAGGIVFPCTSQLNDLTLQLGGGYMATIPGALMNFVALNDGSGNCFGAMQSNAGQGIQIMGDILFKAQIVVFNNKDLTISMAPHA